MREAPACHTHSETPFSPSGDGLTLSTRSARRLWCHPWIKVKKPFNPAVRGERCFWCGGSIIPIWTRSMTTPKLNAKLRAAAGRSRLGALAPSHAGHLISMTIPSRLGFSHESFP
jgi:hypothetical protein